jgi:lipopolysaccharide export system permease protein
MRFEQLAETVDLAERGPLALDVSGGRDANQFRTQYHRRIALPFAPLLFAALGVALGVRRTRSARSWGVLVCVVLTTAYYTLLTFGEYLAESGRWPAALALWLPNALAAGSAVLLLHRTERGET